MPKERQKENGSNILYNLPAHTELKTNLEFEKSPDECVGKSFVKRNDNKTLRIF